MDNIYINGQITRAPIVNITGKIVNAALSDKSRNYKKFGILADFSIPQRPNELQWPR